MWVMMRQKKTKERDKKEEENSRFAVLPGRGKRIRDGGEGVRYFCLSGRFCGVLMWSQSDGIGWKGRTEDGS